MWKEEEDSRWGGGVCSGLKSLIDWRSAQALMEVIRFGHVKTACESSRRL